MSFVELLQQFFALFRWWTCISPWERGLRIRLGSRVKELTPGVWFVIPYVDKVYAQSIRQRCLTLGLQTIKLPSGGQSLSLSLMLGYSIGDIHKLYNTLEHVDSSLAALVAGAAAKAVHSGIDQPKDITTFVMNELHLEQYGLCGVMCEVTDFVQARTYRLIMDQKWNHDGQSLNVGTPIQ